MIAEYCLAFITLQEIATLRSPHYCHSFALPFVVSCVLILARVWIIACLPGLSLFTLPLLDIVRRSSTHACPKDYSVSCPCHTCLLFIDPACIMTMFWNKALHMDPHVSRLVRPVTEYSDHTRIQQLFRSTFLRYGYNKTIVCP